MHVSMRSIAMAARPAFLAPNSSCGTRRICSACHEYILPRQRIPLLNRMAQSVDVNRASTSKQRAVISSISAWGRTQSRRASTSDISRKLPPRGQRIPSRAQAAATELSNQMATSGNDVEYETVIGIETHVQLATATKVSRNHILPPENLNNPANSAYFCLLLP